MRDAPGGAWVRWALRLYGRATAVLPREFRREYGGELEDCFHRIVRSARARGRWAVVSVTGRSIVDLVVRAPVEHLAAARAGALVPGTGLGGGWQDVRHGARRLLRRPSFALAALLTLALGLGASTAVFALVHGVVLRPLPYPESERLVRVDHGGAGLGIDRGLGVTYGFYRFYAARVRSAESMAMYGWLDQTLTGAGEPVRLEGVRTTPSLGRVLRIRPYRGRWLAGADAEAGAAPVVVLSYRLWRDRFGADPSVVGRSVVLEGVVREVVGVMPAGFAFPSSEAGFWIPRSVPRTGVGGWNDLAVARLAPGATPASLERELASLLPLLRETTDDPERVSAYLDDAGVAPRIEGLKESVVGDVRSTLWILMGTVGLVLLIGLANVANLFLVRAEESRREMAVRIALGAGGARLLRGFLAETLLLAGAAGLVGVGVAAVAVAVLKERAPVNVPRLDEVGLHASVLGWALAAVLAVGVVLGLLPLVRRGGLSASLREGHRRATAGRARVRGRSVLVVVQVSLAMILLVGAGLLVRTYRELQGVDPGFSRREALTFQIGLPPARYPEPSDAVSFNRALLGRLEALPGVDAVGGVARCLPLTPNMCWGETLEAEGRPVPPGEVAPVTGARVATAGYFDAMGIRVRGRAFDTGDVSGDVPVAILSRSAARAYFPDEEPLGRRVRFGESRVWYRVVGIADDVRGRMQTDDFLRVIYLPMTPSPADGPPPSPMSFAVATSVPPGGLAPAVRRTVAELDPAVPVADVRTLRGRIADATAPTAFAMALIGLAAAMALLLGSVGVYAVIAYSVSRRTAEIGVRIALGAAAADVRRMVLRQGGAMVGLGVLLGLAAAAALSRFLQGMLYGVSATDPLSYGLLTALMLAVAGLALYLPARRAAGVDPAEALRSE